MVSTGITTQDDLNEILLAGSKGVIEIYQRFRRQFPDRQMKEVGLTDIFMMAAQEKAPKDVKFVSVIQSVGAKPLSLYILIGTAKRRGEYLRLTRS